MNTTTRCKFICDSVLEKADVDEIKLLPVVDTDPNSDNAKFWKYTPDGTIVFTSTNKNLGFIPGKQYFIDITEII